MGLQVFRILFVIGLAAAAAAAAPVATAQPAVSLEGGSSALCPRPEQLSLQRPGPSGQATRVGVGIVVNELVRLDDVGQSISTDVVLVLQWTDRRLADPARSSSLSICSLTNRQVWMPQVQLQGVREFDNYYEDVVGIDAAGTVTHAQRLSLEIAVPLDLRDFPFDRHVLAAEVLPVALGVNDLQFEVMEQMTGIDERVALTGWTIGAHAASIDTRFAPRLQIDQSRYRLEVEVRRESGFYVFKTIVPLALIIFMSWAVFWIDPQQIAPKIALPATSMLTLIAYQFAFIGLLPRISYLTRADRFILSSSIMVFMALVEAVAATRLARTERLTRAERLDRASRFVFPALLVVILLFAFVT